MLVWWCSFGETSIVVSFFSLDGSEFFFSMSTRETDSSFSSSYLDSQESSKWSIRWWGPKEQRVRFELSSSIQEEADTLFQMREWADWHIASFVIELPGSIQQWRHQHLRLRQRRSRPCSCIWALWSPLYRVGRYSQPCPWRYLDSEWFQNEGIIPTRNLMIQR